MNISKVPKKIAKVVARESLETLKKAGEQITATGEYAPNQENKNIQQQQEEKQKQEIEKDKARAQRFYQAHQAELKDMQFRNKQEELKKKQEEEIAKQEANVPKKPPPQLSSIPKRGLALFKRNRSKGIEQRKPPSG